MNTIRGASLGRLFDRLRYDRLTPTQRRAVRDGLIVSGVIFNLTFLIFWTGRFAWFVDTPSWSTIDLSDLYGRAEQSLTEIGAFRMAPVIAWLMYPLTLLPWLAFIVAFTGLNLIAVTVLGRRWALVYLVAFPPVLLEMANGNIHLLMALAIWAGMRWPAAWSFILLTKVTPGIGVLWFAFRREWRNLATAVGATLAIVAVGYVIAPQQWQEWVHSLVLSAQGPQVGTLPSLWVRLPFAVAIVWYAARTSRAWVVPFACVLAMPTIWLQSTALLLASLALYRDRARFQAKTAVEVVVPPADAESSTESAQRAADGRPGDGRAAEGSAS
jgi:hypothetical protein